MVKEFLFILVVIALGNARPFSKTCLSDADCRADSFCKEKYGRTICVTCVQCEEWLFRAPRAHTKCHKSSQECGDCLEGHEKDDLTAGKEFVRCRVRPTDPPLALETPAPTHSLNAVLDEVPPSQREAKGEGNDWGSGKIIGLVLGMISALALALALGAGVCFCYRKRVQICRTGFGQTSNDPEQAEEDIPMMEQLPSYTDSQASPQQSAPLALEFSSSSPRPSSSTSSSCPGSPGPGETNGGEVGAAVNNYQLFLAREEDAKQMAEPNNECRTDNPKVIEGTGGRPRTEISPRSNLIASAPNEEGGEGDEASSSAVSSASTAAVALSSRGQRRGGGGATPFNVEGYKENRKQRHQEQPD